MKTIIIIVIGGVVLWLVDRLARRSRRQRLDHIEFPEDGGDE